MGWFRKEERRRIQAIIPLVHAWHGMAWHGPPPPCMYFFFFFFSILHERGPEVSVV